MKHLPTLRLHISKALLIILMIVACCTEVRGQLVYHNVQPDTTVSGWGNFAFAPFGHGGTSNYMNIWCHPNPDVILVTYNEFEVLRDVNGWPARLDAGAPINATGTWDTAYSAPLNNSGAGNWQTNALGKFLGFRVKKNSDWYYGWIKLSVFPGPDSFTIHDWAYNAPGQPINAGQVFPTSVPVAAHDNSIIMLHAGGKILVKGTRQDLHYDFRISDMAGRLLGYGQYGNGDEIDVCTLPAGLYLLTIVGNKEAAYLKFLVE